MRHLTTLEVGIGARTVLEVCPAETAPKTKPENPPGQNACEQPLLFGVLVDAPRKNSRGPSDDPPARGVHHVSDHGRSNIARPTHSFEAGTQRSAHGSRRRRERARYLLYARPLECLLAER